VGEKESLYSKKCFCKQLPTSYLLENEYTITFTVYVVMPEHDVALFERVCQKLAFCLLAITHRWMGVCGVLRQKACSAALGLGALALIPSLGGVCEEVLVYLFPFWYKVLYYLKL